MEGLEVEGCWRFNLKYVRIIFRNPNVEGGCPTGRRFLKDVIMRRILNSARYSIGLGTHPLIVVQYTIHCPLGK